MSRSHKDLIAWQKARLMVASVYRVTAMFPRSEFHGLTGQMRRAAISVLSNIAEGAARGTDAQFVHFLHVARGSLAELEAQLSVARDLEYLPEPSTLLEDAAEVGRLINGLLRTLAARGAVGRQRDTSQCRPANS